MASKRKIGNLLGLAVLAYLRQRPMHAYEISRTLRANGDDRSIKFNHGSLYMVVGQLAKAGFIVAGETTREGQLPERTVYTLTDAGRAELHDWLADLVSDPGHEYPQFVAALSLVAALPPDEVVALLGRRRERLAATRVEIVAIVEGALAQGVPELFLIEEQYRLALLDAEAAFVDGFVARITDPDIGWGPEWALIHTTFDEGDTP